MSFIDWLGPGDMKLQIGVIGDEGWPMGVHKMGKNRNFRKISKNGKKKKIKKKKEFPISCLKSMHLYFIHHIIPVKNKKMPWGSQWECTKVEKAIFPF